MQLMETCQNLSDYVFLSALYMLNRNKKRDFTVVSVLLHL